MEIGNLNNKELAALEAVLAALAEPDCSYLSDKQVIEIVGDEPTACEICGLLKQHESASQYRFGGDCSLKRTELTASHHATNWYREQRRRQKGARRKQTIMAIVAIVSVIISIVTLLLQRSCC